MSSDRRIDNLERQLDDVRSALVEQHGLIRHQEERINTLAEEILRLLEDYKHVNEWLDALTDTGSSDAEKIQFLLTFVQPTTGEPTDG